VLADIAAFRAAAGLSVNAPILTLVPTSTEPGVLNTGDEQESSLDIEWAGAVAKNATINFVYADPNSNGVITALEYAVTHTPILAPVISMSYGSCEAFHSSSFIASLVAIAQQANAQGITIVAAVGDSGATDCDGSLPIPNYPAQFGLQADFPGSMPYVTGVGGTEFNEGGGTFWQTASGTDVISSALSYIPEMVWNDSVSSASLSAGGGGVSSLFGKPSWQTGTGVPNDGARDVPDVSFNASANHDGYLVCLQFTPQGSTTFTSSCLNNTFRYTDNSLEVFGGTSFGAPIMAGVVALINQKTNSTGQGNINYILYPLAALSPTAFHDITVGDNKSPCVQGTIDCPDPNSIGFSAGSGYDPATGLGTMDVTNLVNSWSSITAPTAGSTPVLTSINPTTIAAGLGDFTLTATGSNFTTNSQILWNGSPTGVTMQTGGTATTIMATISHTLIAFGTSTAGTTGAAAPFTSTFVSVADDAPKAGVPSASQPFTVTSSAPANDNIVNAIHITSSNFAGTVDNSAATTETSDPALPSTCVTPVAQSNFRTKTVWWAVSTGGTAAANVSVSTIGSSYDTTLSVWTGAPGSLTNVACNDDILSGSITQSSLTFAATPGTNYFIMVAPFGYPNSPAQEAGGKTVLNVTGATLATTIGMTAAYLLSSSAVASYQGRPERRDRLRDHRAVVDPDGCGFP